MPVFTVETKGGQKLKIDAASPQEAFDAADEWQRSQPVDGQPLGDESAAAGRAIIDGIPIAGPYLTAGMDRGIAGLRMLQRGENPFGGQTMSGLVEGQTPFQKELEHVQKWGQATADNSPKSTVAGNVLGGITAGVAAAPLVGALAPASRAGQLGLGVIGNGAVSGIDAGIRAPEGQKFQAGGLGTAVGAVGGVVAPLLGTLARKAVDGIYNVGARAGVLRGSGVTPAGARTITRTFGPDADAMVRSAGPDGMIADAGPATSGTLDALIQRGGPAANDAITAINERAASSRGALNSAMDTTLGPAQGIHTAETNIRTSSAAARHAAYDGPNGAYSQGIDYHSPEGIELERQVRRIPDAAIRRANAEMTLRGEVPLADGELPTVAQLDRITRALNDEAKHGAGQGTLGGQTSLGDAHQALARDIRTRLRTLVPAYGHALETAADPIGRREALQFGADLLDKNVPRDVAAETIRGMTGPERAATRQGIRGQMDETLANIEASITDPNVDAREAAAVLKKFSSRAAREKIGLLLTPQEMAHFTETLERAQRSLNLRAATATNSKTAARLGVTEALDQQSAPGVVSNLMQGKLPSAFASGMQLATGTTPADLLALKDELAGQITRALTERRGNDALRLMAQLRQAEAMMQRGNANAKMIGRGVSGGVVGGSAVLPGSVLERDRARRR